MLAARTIDILEFKGGICCSVISLGYVGEWKEQKYPIDCIIKETISSNGICHSGLFTKMSKLRCNGNNDWIITQC